METIYKMEQKLSEITEVALKLCAGLLTVAAALLKFLPKKETKVEKIEDKPIKVVEAPNYNPGNLPLTTEVGQVSKRIKFDTIEEAKIRARILFIDDDKQYKHYKILRNNGWQNSNLITDLNSIDAENARMADIFFVDIHGVGKKMSFQDEGLGLARALMERYPEKYVIMYSSESNGNRFHETLQKADYALSKFADIYEFEKCLSRFLVKGNDK